MGHVNQKSTEKSNQPNNEESINPDQYTVIMPDDDARKPCAICGERFIDFWNDDEEEWMYKNAILIDGKVKLDVVCR
jgi:pre-mRNA cleavage complex 2 protein Pcf11